MSSWLILGCFSHLAFHSSCYSLIFYFLIIILLMCLLYLKIVSKLTWMPKDIYQKSSLYNSTYGTRLWLPRDLLFITHTKVINPHKLFLFRSIYLLCHICKTKDMLPLYVVRLVADTLGYFLDNILLSNNVRQKFS